MKTQQKENLFYKERKGQSAIEYLMTYGWMLLVVAIVGGAIFATVQGQCTSSSTGFGDNVEVDDFGVDGDGNMQLVLRNTGNDPVFLTGGELSQEIGGDTQPSAAALETTDNEEINETDEVRIDVTSTETVQFSNAAAESAGCNDLGLSLDYEVGSLTGQSESGTLTDEHEIDEA